MLLVPFLQIAVRVDLTFGRIDGSEKKKKKHSPSFSFPSSSSFLHNCPLACLPPPSRIVCPVPWRRLSRAPGGNRRRSTHAKALFVSLVFGVVVVVDRRCPRCRGPGRQGADPCPAEAPRLHAAAPGVHRRVQQVSFWSRNRHRFLSFLTIEKSGQRALPPPPPPPPAHNNKKIPLLSATSASTSTTRPAPRSSPASPPTTRTRPLARSSAPPSTTRRACRTSSSTRCSAARASTRSRSRSSS